MKLIKYINFIAKISNSCHNITMDSRYYNSKQILLNSEMTNDITHRPIEEEYHFYDAVKNGDMNYIRKNLEAKAFTNPEGMGVLSSNQVRNIRYHFVTSTAMITRYCVDGGMELERAYRLSDYYIFHMDELKTIDDIAALHDRMVLDFTTNMALLRNRKIISKAILKCIDYIYKNIDTRILTCDLAWYVGLSENYLSRLFSKELGVSISEYIREKKIDKAVELLKYTDMSAAEIANQLSFSSQSHFIQVFKASTGMSPKKYKDRLS